jgi:hypothetical protein
MRDFAIARIGSDGRLVTDCFDDAGAATKALHTPAPARTNAEEE